MDFLWPVLEDLDSVKDALRYAAVISAVLCGYDLLFFGLSPFVVGICVVYAFAAWRIWKGSPVFAITAFAILCLQSPRTFVVLLLFAFVGLMNGVRAAIVFERLQHEADMASLSQPRTN
jgi:hypothetical protein